VMVHSRCSLALNDYRGLGKLGIVHPGSRRPVCFGYLPAGIDTCALLNPIHIPAVRLLLQTQKESHVDASQFRRVSLEFAYATYP
jgi:hypothetical protein